MLLSPFFLFIIVIFAKQNSTMEINGLTILSCFYWIYNIVAIILAVNIVLKNRDSVKTLAWVMVLLFIPFLGILLYFFFGRDTRKKKMIGNRLMSQIKQRTLHSPISYTVKDIPYEYKPLLSFFRNTVSATPLPAESLELFADTRRFAIALLRELESAQHHIHMQFYMFEDDMFGRSIRDAIMRKARQGIEVRLIYDSIGCWSVNKNFFEEMRSAGVYVESFLKVRIPLFSDRVNYRNHRKLVIVDGKTGFIGGCNIAERYVTGGVWGRWCDTMLLVKGVAVHGLQSSFLVDWYFANRSLVSGKEYFPSTEASGDAVVQVVPSNPVGEVRTLMSGFVKLLATAHNYVYLQTPYFMPNESFMLALKNAALSGVDVRLVIPERSDNRLAGYASKSYLGDLLKVGVKVYLYKEGFLHSKTIVCDDYISSIGSSNFDFRSFFCNFEVNAFVYHRPLALELKNCFLEDIKHCHQLTLGEYRNRPLWLRCFESCARLFSPLL